MYIPSRKQERVMLTTPFLPAGGHTMEDRTILKDIPLEDAIITGDALLTQ